jgi:hypothetical protein
VVLSCRGLMLTRMMYFLRVNLVAYLQRVGTYYLLEIVHYDIEGCGWESIGGRKAE